RQVKRVGKSLANAVAPVRRSPINDLASKEKLRCLGKIALEIIYVGPVGEFFFRQSPHHRSSYAYLISHWQPAHKIRKSFVPNEVKNCRRVREIALGCRAIHEFREREKLRERLLITVTRRPQNFKIVKAATLGCRGGLVPFGISERLKFSPFLFARVVVQLHQWLPPSRRES